MSDVSVLSSQYETLIETSDKVNNSIIAFKKKNLLARPGKKYATLQVSKDDIDKASSFIVHFLSELNALLHGFTTKTQDIPAAVVEEYVKKLEQSIPTLKQDVDEIVRDVKEKSTLEGDQLEIMDKILMTLDSERKVLFRKLRST